MGASHLVKTKRTLTDELPSCEILAAFPRICHLLSFLLPAENYCCRKKAGEFEMHVEMSRLLGVTAERSACSHNSPAVWGQSWQTSFLKHDSSILRQSSNLVFGFSLMEQGRLCAVWPTENWLCSSMNHIQGWTTV